MCRIHAFVWIKQFQNRREVGRDDERSSHLTSSRDNPNVEEVTEMVRHDHQLTI